MILQFAEKTTSRFATVLFAFAVVSFCLGGLVDSAQAFTPAPPVQKSGKGAKGNSGKGIESNVGKGVKSNGSHGQSHSPGNVQRHGNQSQGNQHQGNQHQGSQHQGAGRDSHSDHGHNSNYQNHNSNYRSYPSRGSTYLNISPQGLSFGFGSNGSYGGISTYYRPNYAYDTYPYAGNGYSSPYAGYGYSVPYAAYPYSASAGVYSSPAISYYTPELSPVESAAQSRLYVDPSTTETYPQISTNATARSFQQRAEQAFKLGNYAEASRLTEQALMLDSENGTLMLFASQASFAIGDYDRAAKLVEQATGKLAPDLIGSVVENFRSFYGRNDYVSQMDRLTQQIDRNPNDAQALALRGYQYGALGYIEAATKDFRRALTVNPNNGLATRLLPLLEPPKTAEPEEIQAPTPAGTSPPKNSGVIRLVPQSTVEKLGKSGLETRSSIPLSGPEK